ncbi:MAG: hypothetical protein M3440_13850 [Chloroflexota bacterium]|nr:hypothetical protein [Chloroflexota bacterium]
MEETGDPLLLRGVPVPPGARVNDPASATFSEDLLDSLLRRIPNLGTIRQLRLSLGQKVNYGRASIQAITLAAS